MKYFKISLLMMSVCSFLGLHTASPRDWESFKKALYANNTAEMVRIYNDILKADTLRPRWAEMARAEAAHNGIDLEALIAARRGGPVAPAAPAPVAPRAPLAPVAAAPVCPAPVAPTVPAAPAIPEAPALAPGTRYAPTRPSAPTPPAKPVVAPIEIEEEEFEIAAPAMPEMEEAIPVAPPLSKEEAERYATSRTESPDIGYSARRLKPRRKEKIVIGEEAPVAPNMIAPNAIKAINDEIAEVKRMLTAHRMFNFTEKATLVDIKTKIEELQHELASVQNYADRRRLADVVDKLASALDARRAKNDNLTQDELNRIMDPMAAVMPAAIEPEEELPAGIPSAPTLSKKDAEKYATSRTESLDIGYGARRLKPLPKERIIIGEEAPIAPSMGGSDTLKEINTDIAEIERQLTRTRWLNSTERSAQAEIQQLIDAAQKNAENISHYNEKQSVLNRLNGLQNALEKRKALNKALTNEELRALINTPSIPSFSEPVAAEAATQGQWDNLQSTLTLIKNTKDELKPDLKQYFSALFSQLERATDHGLNIADENLKKLYREASTWHQFINE